MARKREKILYQGLPGFRPEERQEREAYEQRNANKLLSLAIERDNARIAAEKKVKALEAQIAELKKGAVLDNEAEAEVVRGMADPPRILTDEEASEYRERERIRHLIATEYCWCDQTVERRRENKYRLMALYWALQKLDDED